MPEQQDESSDTKFVRNYLKNRFGYVLLQINEVLDAERALRRRDFTAEAWAEFQTVQREKDYWLRRLSDEVLLLIQTPTAPTSPEMPNP